MKWFSALSARTQIDEAPHLNAFKGIEGELTLNGPLAEVELSFNYENTNNVDLELHLIFPLAADAVLLGVDLKINDTILHGKILAADAAEQNYEDAISDGNTPVLIERLFGNQIRMQLGNLMPEETAVVTLRYSQFVTPKSGECKFTLPTTIAPRFGAQPDNSGLPNQPSSNALVAYPIYLHVMSNPEQHRELICPSGHAETSLDEPSTHYLRKVCPLGEYYFCGLMNRDLVITWHSPSAIGQGLLIAPEQPTENAAFLAQFELPLPDAVRHQSNSVTLKLLIDCSGSMAGDSIVAAREGAMHALNLLRDNERFAVSLFGNSVQPMTQGLQNWQEKNRASWRRALASVDATLGGTEMELALKHTLAISNAQNETERGDILLITDGQVTDINAMVSSLRQAKHRVFAIGVGTAPAESQLAALAKASGGECLLVSPGEDLRMNIERLMSRMRAPQVHDMKVLLADSDATWLADLPKQASANGVFQLYGQLPSANWNGQLIVSGAIESQQHLWRISLPVQNCQSVAASTMVHYQRVVTLPSQEQAAYALQHGLLTEDTRLLCIYERAEDKRAGCMPVLDDISHMAMMADLCTSPEFICTPSYSGDFLCSPMARPEHLIIRIEKAQRRWRLLSGHAKTPASMMTWLSAASSIDELQMRIEELETEGLPVVFRTVLCAGDIEQQGELILGWLAWLYGSSLPEVLEKLINDWNDYYGASSTKRLMNALSRIHKKLPNGPWQAEFSNRLSH